MEKWVTSDFRLGIVGGGQLGRMLALKAANWDIRTAHLDSSEDAPAHIIADQFQKGSITSYDDVLRFGETVDVVTVESDNVNADALEVLAERGKRVYPKAATLRIIQDKGKQRTFCRDQGLPVPHFEVFESRQAFLKAPSFADWKFPYIVKTRTAGYDGKGVFLIKEKADLDAVPDVGLVIEEKIELDRELTVIVARNADNEIAAYPVIELFMSPSAYLVDYLIGPAKIEAELQKQAQEIGHALVEALDIQGMLAIELFVSKSGRLLINECSPRPHNSGHQTIEGSYTSQYEQHLRGIMSLPLGSCETKVPAGMVNLLGDLSANGKVRYEGLTECLSIPGVKLHIYGKKQVKPLRKMGHITVLDQNYEELLRKIQIVKDKVRVLS